ncbi:hypothetical protein GJ496_002266 [Pomphorhynchus laevis]|nr:hypothetical protein GJ496_002266 [Pomphorhynchus laevis]
MVNHIHAIVAICLTAIYLISSTWALKCERNAWPADEHHFVKERVVNLDLPPEERWEEIMKEHKFLFIELVNKMKSQIREVFHVNEGFFEMLEIFIPDHVKDNLAEEYWLEMEGIAKSSNLHISYIITTNILYEIAALCTTATQYDESIDDIVQLRNLDFGIMMGWDHINNRWIIQEYLQPLLMSVNFTSSGKTLFRSVGYAGSIGVLTGMKPSGFAISINLRFSINGGYLGLMELFFNIINNQSFATLAVRDVLTNVNTYEAAVANLSHTPLISSVYFTISGVRPHEGCVLARSRTRLVDRWEIQSLSQNIRDKLLVQTNYDRNKPQPITDNRVYPVYRCVVESPKNQSIIAKLYNALSTNPVGDIITIHTTIMCARNNIFKSYLRNFTL